MGLMSQLLAKNPEPVPKLQIEILGPCVKCQSPIFWRSAHSTEFHCVECFPAPHVAMVFRYVAWQDGELIPLRKDFTRQDAQPPLGASATGAIDEDGLYTFQTPDNHQHVRLAAYRGDTSWQQADETAGQYERRLRRGWAYQSMAAVLDRTNKADP